MFSRYRSYTTYSEENGKLVPSIEPNISKLTNKSESTSKIPDTDTQPEKKLKPDEGQNEGAPVL